MAANASGPRDSLAYPCAMNPPPTTRRNTNRDHSDRDDRFATAIEVLPCTSFRPVGRHVGVSSRSATACRRAISVVRVPLLPPWISVVVVAVALPEPWLVVIHQRQAAHPFGALPQVQVGDEQPGRATVFRRQVRAVVAERDPGLSVHEVTDRQVRR